MFYVFGSYEFIETRTLKKKRLEKTADTKIEKTEQTSAFLCLYIFRSTKHYVFYFNRENRNLAYMVYDFTTILFSDVFYVYKTRK